MCCYQGWRLVVFRLVENDVDVIVTMNLHQMYYGIYLRVGASARLTLEFLVFPVVIEVFILYIGLPSNHMKEVTGRLLWFSVPPNVFFVVGTTGSPSFWDGYLVRVRFPPRVRIISSSRSQNLPC